jgi:hypothetical protein
LVEYVRPQTVPCCSLLSAVLYEGVVQWHLVLFGCFDGISFDGICRYRQKYRKSVGMS